ncbi:biosynthetic-type acetolactate synthase large subunit [Gordonia polyisoprenivorans]|uniref:biosynthetic-type acetolactate synthase large subunit n=1 Tax=Gordonia polyisoprenivorans TaxID=84595 RepID=UPI001AD70E5E|nr:biosynthetic-type acetolactate synthase large subunit [Gordonia polyisoprenivorans]QTI70693.1 biosynthetic-type acetolactate synthase large subunit [Gordonia polyisoprenivorans]
MDLITTSSPHSRPRTPEVRHLIDDTLAESSCEGEQLTGATALARSLEALAVEAIFALPTADIMPMWAALGASATIRTVAVRHEQGAGHAAAGYAIATGRTGVCLVAPGSGATNLVTALADANMDSVPIVAIIANVPTGSLGTDTSAEIDTIGMTQSITKHSFRINDPGDIPGVIAQAFHIASTGRPGPVVVAVPLDVATADLRFAWPPQFELRGYSVATTVANGDINGAVREIRSARAPVLYIGGGVIKAGASRSLRELAELTRIPVVTTLMARGALPDHHPQHYGMPGMHGTVAAVAALQKSDLIIAIGARFDDRVTGEAHSFAPNARVIHIDIDPAEIGKNRRVDVAIVGHARTAIRALTLALRSEVAQRQLPDLGGWQDYLDQMHQDYSPSYADPVNGTLSPERVIQTLSRSVSAGTIFSAGVGQHQMWAANYIDFSEPRTWLNSGGLGTMGFAVPAAIGAQVGHPGREVWAIDGDGCFQMTGRELATAAAEGLPIKVAIINNGNLGMVRQLQTMHYDGRFHGVDLATKTRLIPDFVRYAEALGCAAFRCTDRVELDETILAARSVTDRPVVVDFVVSDETLVWPMIAAGASNDEILTAGGVRPLFESAD